MKKAKLIFVIALFAIMLVPGILIVVKHDRVYSELENRNLTVRPAFNISEILSGKTESDLTEFVTDQFPLRDFLMKTSTEYKKGLLMKDVGGVYFGKNGYVLDKLYEGKLSFEDYRKNIAKLRGRTASFTSTSRRSSMPTRFTRRCCCFTAMPTPTCRSSRASRCSPP